jgi:hypothetical protein
MKLNLPNAVTTRMARQSLVLQKASPRILFYSGLALMGATVVTACKGTLKLEGVLEDVRRDREDVKENALRNPDKFTDRDISKLNFYITAKGLARIGQLYLPAVSLGVASVACLTTSHNQLTRRNAGLSAALAATERALDSYRARVRESIGEERELKLWRDEKKTEQPVLDDEGRETKSMKKVKTGGGMSPYARVWGRDTSNEWSPQAEYNLAKLRSVQEYGTMVLNSRGHLFLNEIHDELGLDRTPAGAVVGWLSKKYGGADGYVDFGVLNRSDDEQIRFLDFVTGREDHILLDFNVDGEIWRNI